MSALGACASQYQRRKGAACNAHSSHLPHTQALGGGGDAVSCRTLNRHKCTRCHPRQRASTLPIVDTRAHQHMGACHELRLAHLAQPQLQYSPSCSTAPTAVQPQLQYTRHSPSCSTPGTAPAAVQLVHQHSSNSSHLGWVYAPTGLVEANSTGFGCVWGPDCMQPMPPQRYRQVLPLPCGGCKQQQGICAAAAACPLAQGACGSIITAHMRGCCCCCCCNLQGCHMLASLLHCHPHMPTVSSSNSRWPCCRLCCCC